MRQLFEKSISDIYSARQSGFFNLWPRIKKVTATDNKLGIYGIIDDPT